LTASADSPSSLEHPAPETLRLGSCSFTAVGWAGSFYPRGLSSKEFLRFYAEEFDTVELDVTWYRVPTPSMIEAWYERTPPGFSFAAKVPQTITHDKVMLDCRRELNEFLDAMAGLKEKLGPLLFQFPYFKREQMRDVDEFLRLLKPFLAELPEGFRYALEVRNGAWIAPPLIDLLQATGVALAITDHPYMPPLEEWFRRVDPITAQGFTYIRWLGDRHGIERLTKTWDKVVVDRSADLDRWTERCQAIRRRGVTIHGYVNNHYAGHSPATMRSLLDRLEPSLRRERPEPPPPRQRSLF